MATGGTSDEGDPKENKAALESFFTEVIGCTISQVIQYCEYAFLE